MIIMKSAFGSKRKPRKIQVDEDDDADTPVTQEPQTQQSTKASTSTTRKVFKGSSLRQSINFNDDQLENANCGEEVGDEDLSRPSIGRSSSMMRKKKKAPSSRLSFGPGEIISGDAAEALEDDELFTPIKTGLGRRIVDSSSLRGNLSAYKIPIRGGEDDEERPTYSKDYLNELKSSTPSTPKDLGSLVANVGDDEGLDESELDGAMVVDIVDNTMASVIPTEAEIREKKERRARLAHEEDFISLDDRGDNRQEISLLPRKKKVESRLVREDEDLGEGFDEFVDDGRVSLGKKAEREAKRRQRAQIADLIHEAEGSSSDASDDSEAERHAAYEAAQTRAGMDGMSKPDLHISQPQVPPKITALPNLTECLQRLQTTLSGMQQELAKRTRKMADLQLEKGEILGREQEVQRLLKEAGDRYSVMRADTGLPDVHPTALADGPTGFADSMTMNRGLESFGNTPVARPDMEDVG